MSDICTLTQQPLAKLTSTDTSELFLLRYVKPSYIKNQEPTDESLQLREDRLPPEEYLSFFQSSKLSVEERFKDFIGLMELRKFQLAKKSGILHLSSEDIDNEVNIPRKLVEIKDCKKPHFGLFFCSQEEEDILEAKTTLLYLADFELTNNLL